MPVIPQSKLAATQQWTQRWVCSVLPGELLDMNRYFVFFQLSPICPNLEDFDTWGYLDATWRDILVVLPHYVRSLRCIEQQTTLSSVYVFPDIWFLSHFQQLAKLNSQFATTWPHRRQSASAELDTNQVPYLLQIVSPDASGTIWSLSQLKSKTFFIQF